MGLFEKAFAVSACMSVFFYGVGLRSCRWNQTGRNVHDTYTRASVRTDTNSILERGYVAWRDSSRGANFFRAIRAPCYMS